MNAPTQRAETTALATTEPSLDLSANAVTAASLILGPSFDRVMLFAELMSKGSATTPKHLRGNKADCFAVTAQALSLNFDPLAFARKTHLDPSGNLAYDGQLVSAILSASGAVEGDPQYEHIGDWDKVLGKVEERKSDSGGKYYVATYTKKDEEGLGVIVRARIKGEKADRELKVMMSQCFPRFSTMWATDPRQQICNLAIRKWVRLHKPSVLLGYRFADGEDEFEAPKDMGTAEVVSPKVDPALLTAAEAAAKKGRAAYAEFWKGLKHGQRAALDEQSDNHERLKKIAADVDDRRTVDNQPRGATPAATPAPSSAPAAAAASSSDAAGAGQQPTAQDDGQFKPTYAKVHDMMKKAAAEKNADALDVASDWIGEIPDADQRKELTAHYEAFKREIAGGQA